MNGQATSSFLQNLEPHEFRHLWYRVGRHSPGLHPDEVNNPEGGWPKDLKEVGREAWRRRLAGSLSDDDLYWMDLMPGNQAL